MSTGSLIAQLFFDGLAMGLVYVILACGLVLITSVNRILFLAYGVFYTIGAYAAWYVMDTLRLPYPVALVAGAVCAGMIGVLTYVAVFKRLMRTEGGFLATLLASMGILAMLSQGNLLLFGTAPRGMGVVFSAMWTVKGVNIASAKVALIAISLAVTGILFVVYERSRLGRGMRTVSFLPPVAPILGINVERIYLVTMGVGTGLAGIAGGILAPSYGMSPTMGADVLWTVILLCMLGGMDSLLGAVVGGFVIGELLSFGQFYVGGWIELIIFAVIGVVLYFRPDGLLGRGVDVGV